MQALEQDFKRDFFLNAQEAMDYGLVDKLTMPKRLAKLKAKDNELRANSQAQQTSAADDALMMDIGGANVMTIES